jgi:uncharacterized protein YpmS
VSAATGGWTAAFLILLAVAALVVLVYALLTTEQVKRTSADAVKLRATQPNAHTQVTSALTGSAETSLTL